MDANGAHLGVVEVPADDPAESGASIVAALELAYGAVRHAFPALPDAVIITGSGLSGRGLRWGHFSRDAWHDAVSQGRRPELFIGGERLATGAVMTMQTLLHECTHALADATDVQDTSRQGRYHNRRFVAIAETLGLAYEASEPDSVIGFSDVHLTREGQDRWASEISAIDDAIHLGQNTELLLLMGLLALVSYFGSGRVVTGGAQGLGTLGRRGTGGSSYVKATCACEPIPRVIRVSRSTLDAGSITCGVCGADFTG